MITVPAGTLILVQTTDELDTSYTQTGQVFSATLVTNLANGDVVARSGTPVYGQVVAANSAGRATGRSKMELQLTQIVINGESLSHRHQYLFHRRQKLRPPLGFSSYSAARDWAPRSGPSQEMQEWARPSAQLPAASAQLCKKGNQVQIPAETQLQFTLQQPLTLPALPNSY